MNPSRSDMRAPPLSSRTVLATVFVMACAPPPNPYLTPTSCAGTLSADSTVYDSAQVDEQPKYRQPGRVFYPATAFGARIQGDLVLKAIVGTKGRVDPQSVVGLQSVRKDVDDAGINSLLTSSFWPACLKGHAVRAWRVVAIGFRVPYWGKLSPPEPLVKPRPSGPRGGIGSHRLALKRGWLATP